MRDKDDIIRSRMSWLPDFNQFYGQFTPNEIVYLLDKGFKFNHESWGPFYRNKKKIGEGGLSVAWFINNKTAVEYYSHKRGMSQTELRMIGVVSPEFTEWQDKLKRLKLIKENN